MAKRNPNLLDLLRDGAKVTFWDGFSLRGIIPSGYIQIANDDLREDYGLWCLDAEGLKNALSDLKNLREQRQEAW